MTSDLPRDVTLLTSYLPAVLNPQHWVCSIDPESLARATNEEVGWVERHWDAMLESGFVEAVPPGHTALRLVFPEE